MLMPGINTDGYGKSISQAMANKVDPLVLAVTGGGFVIIAGRRSFLTLSGLTDMTVTVSAVALMAGLGAVVGGASVGFMTITVSRGLGRSRPKISAAVDTDMPVRGFARSRGAVSVAAVPGAKVRGINSRKASTIISHAVTSKSRGVARGIAAPEIAVQASAPIKGLLPMRLFVDSETGDLVLEYGTHLPMTENRFVSETETTATVVLEPPTLVAVVDDPYPSVIVEVA